MSQDQPTEQTTKPMTWVLCDLCHGVAHDPDPEGWGEPCDNCAGNGGRWVEVESNAE